MYEYSLFWFNPVEEETVFLGDYFTVEEIEKVIEYWCEECEHPSARDSINYIIRRLEE